ncbi:TMEM165/GDT1 family protein [Synechococcus sp. H55.2]|uniref:TMEM165/GDT1 family protein n=1 Tax=unclassified Synechococcus TaxID=2626047 RepID=UPI0039C4245C
MSVIVRAEAMARDSVPLARTARSWQGQLTLGLGLIAVSLALCFGFLTFGQHYLNGERAAADFRPAGESLAPSVALDTELPTAPPLTDLPSAEGSPLQLWLVTFLTVFVAEMGDKTQLATLLMSAQSQSPWAIFFGSASALVAASLLSVVLGEGLGQVIPPGWLQWLAGAGFLVIGGYVLWQEWRGDDPPERQPLLEGRTEQRATEERVDPR